MKGFTDKSLIDGVVEGDIRMIARFITLSENRIPRAKALLGALPKRKHPAHIVGITGSPGAGKSSLIEKLGLHIAETCG